MDSQQAGASIVEYPRAAVNSSGVDIRRANSQCHHALHGRGGPISRLRRFAPHRGVSLPHPTLGNFGKAAGICTSSMRRSGGQRIASRSSKLTGQFPRTSRLSATAATTGNASTRLICTRVPRLTTQPIWSDDDVLRPARRCGRPNSTPTRYASFVQRPGAVHLLICWRQPSAWISARSGNACTVRPGRGSTDTVIALGLAYLGAQHEQSPVPARSSYAFAAGRR